MSKQKKILLLICAFVLAGLVSIILLNKRHTWWQSFDGPFERRTNLEKYK